jgi:hypothetical protein
VRSNEAATHIEDADVVAAETLRGPGMEVPGVFIPLSHRLELSPLFPVGGMHQDQTRMRGPAEHTQRELVFGEDAVLLEEVKQVNDKFAVIF